MEYDRVLASRDFSEILRCHNSALQLLEEFKQRYPYLIAPNVIDSLTHSLRDNISIMYREFSHMQSTSPEQQGKRFVCKQCHKVFYTSLPNDICDECRAKGGTR